jgi:hypothetical protein
VSLKPYFIFGAKKGVRFTQTHLSIFWRTADEDAKKNPINEKTFFVKNHCQVS